VHRPANTSRGRSGELFSAIVDDLLDAGLSVRFRASGNSMSPTIRDGEYLVVAPLASARADIGDIVYCQMRRGPIAHRVCDIDAPPGAPRRFRLYGDASLDGDLPVAAHQLRGRVLGVERDGALVSLKIAGGVLGRTVFMLTLRLRRSIRVARAQLSAPLAAAPTGR
jgi:hypothetical protein